MIDDLAANTPAGRLTEVSRPGHISGRAPFFTARTTKKAPVPSRVNGMAIIRRMLK